MGGNERNGQSITIFDFDRHKADAHHVMLAAASIDFYSAVIAPRLAIDTVACTRSTWDSAGRLVVRIDGDNCRGPAKLKAVREALPWPREDCRIVAYSDHVSDLPVLEWAGRGVAVNPRRRFGLIARSRGLDVVDWNQTAPAGPGDRDQALITKAAER